MSNNSQSPSASPRRRRPQTRLGNDASAVLVDLRLPAAAKRRRLTLASVSAVCEQLGEHVSTRNVQRMLGGSLRDIGPLVQAWRDNRAAAGVTAAAGDQAQALGAILIGALQDQAAAIAAALERHAVATAASQRDLLDRMERLLHQRLRARSKPTHAAHDIRPSEADGLQHLRADLQFVRDDVGRLLARSAAAAPVATGNDLAELGSRFDRLAQAVDQLQAEQRAPRPDPLDVTIASALSAAWPDLDARMAPVVDRLDGLARILAATTDSKLRAPELAPTLDRIEAALAAVLAPKPPKRAQPSQAILKRLDALLTASASLPAQLKAALTTPKRKRKTPPPRPARKPASKQAVRRTAKATTLKKSTKSAPKVVTKKTVKSTLKKTVKSATLKKSTKSPPKAVTKKTVKLALKKIVNSATATRQGPAKRSPLGSTVSRRNQTGAVAPRKKSPAQPRKRPVPAKSVDRRKSKR